MYLLDLALICRRAGLKVVEVDGWRTRSAKTRFRGPKAVLCHHTGSSAKAHGNYPTYGTIKSGRTGLPGPLAQLGLGRDGTVYVFAAGSANHNYPAQPAQFGNATAIGIEAEHPGGKAVWPKAQYSAYVTLVAALCKAYKIPADMSGVRGHKEATTPGRKVDPNFNMGNFRAAVREALKPKAREYVVVKTCYGHLKPVPSAKYRTPVKRKPGWTFTASDITTDPGTGRRMVRAARLWYPLEALDLVVR